MDTHDLSSLLRQKKELLEKMLELTQQFTLLLEQDRVDDFAEGLKNRETIIQKVDSLAKMEKRFRLPDETDPDGLIKQTQNIIREILKLDAKNAALAAEKINGYKQQIKSLNEKKKGIGNYAKTGQDDDAFYVDAKK